MWMKIVLVRRSVLERGARTREINHLLSCKRSYRVILICIYEMMAKLMNYLCYLFITFSNIQCMYNTFSQNKEAVVTVSRYRVI